MEAAVAPLAPKTASILWEVLGAADYTPLEEEGYRRYVKAEESVVLLHVHLLPSTVALFERLLELGFRPESIVIIPKVYSTIPEAEQAIRRLGCVIVEPNSYHFLPGDYDSFAADSLERGVAKAAAICNKTSARRCILVDDGGILTDIWSRQQHGAAAFDTVSVQQTASGLYRQRLNSTVRRINVATSAAKIHFESRIIVEGVLRKVRDLHLLKGPPSRVAIIGLGALGSNLARLLRDRHRLSAYDIKQARNIEGVERERDWQSCIKKADIVFGCTGKNFMHFSGDYASAIQKRKSFLSLSSRDVEFRRLLLAQRRLISQQYSHGERCYGEAACGGWQRNAFGNIAINTNKDVSSILYNGGFPVNFDRTHEWESECDISLTRGLVLVAIIQSLCVPKPHNPKSIEKLAVNSQRRLVELWLNKKDQTSEAFGVSPSQFRERSWWLRASREPR